MKLPGTRGYPHQFDPPFSILGRIEGGEAGGVPAGLGGGELPFSILGRIEGGEARRGDHAGQRGDRLSVSSAGSKGVKLFDLRPLFRGYAEPFSILGRIEGGEANAP